MMLVITIAFCDAQMYQYLALHSPAYGYEWSSIRKGAPMGALRGVDLHFKGTHRIRYAPQTTPTIII